MAGIDEGLQLPGDESLWDIDYADLEIEKEISAGGFGAVYLGNYCGTPVAIKQLFDPDNSIIQKLITREVEILKSLRHPNIVQFMGMCYHDGECYIVTEYVNGGHLWSVLKNKSTALSWTLRVQMAIDVAQAMNYLHRRKLLHRDLKTKNLLVESPTYRVKVCDFGFARTTADESSKYMTKTGTSLWMAPEMYLSKPYSSKADVFSYGVILREIITRSQPPARNPRHGFGFEQSAFFDGAPADCPPDFLQLAWTCAATNPDDRPDFSAVLAQLKDLLPSVSSSSTPASSSASTSTPSPAPPPPARPPRTRQDTALVLPLPASSTTSAVDSPALLDPSDLDVLLSSPLLQTSSPPPRHQSPAVPLLPPGLALPPGLSSPAAQSSDALPLLVGLFEQPTAGTASPSSSSPSSPSSSSSSSSSSAAAGSSPLVLTGSTPSMTCSDPISSLLARYPFGSVENLRHVLRHGKPASAEIEARVPLELLTRVAPIRVDLYELLDPTLALWGRNPAFHEAIKKAIRIPPKLSKIEWILCCVLESYELLISCWALVTPRCTASTCPTLNASETTHYTWADGEKIKSPIEVNAQEYAVYLNDWIAAKLEDPALFPAGQRFSTKVVTPTLKICAKKLLRLFAHIYFCHWSYIVSVDMAPIYTAVFAFVYHVFLDFKLMDSRADSTTIEPVSSLCRNLGMAS